MILQVANWSRSDVASSVLSSFVGATSSAVGSFTRYPSSAVVLAQWSKRTTVVSGRKCADQLWALTVTLEEAIVQCSRDDCIGISWNLATL